MNKSNHSRSRKRRTAAQHHASGSFGGASREWAQLTDPQRQTWDERAKEEKRRRRWGRDRRLTGQNLHTELNSNQAFLGLPPLLCAPDRPVLGLDRIGPLTINCTRAAPTLKLAVPKLSAGYLLVYGSPPCSAGRRCCRDYRFLGLLPVPVRGYSDITRMYLKKFGNLPPGSRVFIQVRHQLHGWRNGMPSQTDAIVPGQPPAASPWKSR